jgi:pimeloyl-ACP methyl ester carboxylesterase
LIIARRTALKLTMEKIPVYFMPGLAASPGIFENIHLPAERFECHYLEWLLPENLNEPLAHYAARVAEGIKHENAILIGVSFGGVLVQEMAKRVKVRKVVIISSVRCNGEFPRRMVFAKRTHIYSIFPTGMMQNIEWLARFSVGNSKVAKRVKLYEKFLAVRDKKYLDWAFKSIINWDCTEPDMEVIHIHGDEDEVFPPKYLREFIPVPGGTHIMILNKAKWLNEHLPQILEK